ncbi:hypothetical protein MUK42_25094 [Musa troglodytarum]|uniref:Bifunctional inhibitor/plant lipid transfer protein/seed storage helical domain-containing protein n=1 Tax=Musa troglodytarum TaxID=320322 RepID=A0A9E7LFY9_9LILI|nr:hypothetical protein MUK42_25094 [Musa troglodytarum]
MAKLLCFMAAVAICFSLASATADAPRPSSSLDCTDAGSHIELCRPYLENGSHVLEPSEKCCDVVSGIHHLASDCLCEVLKASVLGAPLNATRASRLPTFCHLPPAHCSGMCAVLPSFLFPCNPNDLFEKCSNVETISGTINVTTAISGSSHSYTSNSASQFTSEDTTRTPCNTTTFCIAVNSATGSNRYAAAKHSSDSNRYATAEPSPDSSCCATAAVSNYHASANSCCYAAA